MARVLFVAGEASGDRCAARLLRELGARCPVDALGLGGAELENAGMRLIADVRRVSAMGTTELLPHLPGLGVAWARLAGEIVRRPPDLAVLVDAPDFNLPLARLCRARGVAVLSYVGPQVWAWRAGRLRTMARTVTHAALVLPFELPLYRRAGVPATFVGHPVLDEPAIDRATARVVLGVPDDAPVLAVLPGSRGAELGHHLPALIGAARLLRARRPGLRVLLPVAPSLSPAHVRRLLVGSPIEAVERPAAMVLAAADVALVATGTASLEAARAAVPAVFFHRASPMTWAIGRALVRVPHLALPNLLLGRRAFPELWQDAVDPERLAAEASILFDDPGRADLLRQAAAAVVGRLGAPGAARRVAEIAEGLLAGARRSAPRRSGLAAHA